MARLNKYDRRHQSNLNKYIKLIEQIYKIVAAEAARIGVSLTGFNPDKIFSFDDYPMTKRQIDALLNTYRRNLTSVIVNGVRSSWTLANNKNDELCRQVFGDMVGKLSKAQYRRYFNNNEDALNAFLKRKESGLRLSDRVWNYTNQFKREIELGLDIGIRQGMSADELSRQLRDFLKYPDKLFRRVRDEHGQLQLSKAASEFHPGRGVYRSSYKNARRLAVTETNMAYRSADHERWQQMDFVVGIKIEVSDTNHPIPDICDDLAGKYPKDFKFTGWHPHCRCHVLTILKTMEEMADDAKRIMRGEEPSEHSVNEVTDVPQGFKDWCDDNKDRAKKAYTMPYFIAENPKYIPKGLADIIESPHKKGGVIEIDLLHTQRTHKALGTKTLASLNKEQQDNATEVANILGANISRPMTFDMADNGNVNPKYGQSAKFERNCSLSVVTAEARIRGIDVQALGVIEPRRGKKSIAYDLGLDFTKAWVKPNGEKPTLLTLDVEENFEITKGLIQTLTKENGRYYLGFDGDIINHAINIYRQNGKLYLFDQQINGSYNLFDFLRKMGARKIEILRIDNLLFDTTFVSHWMTS